MISDDEKIRIGKAHSIGPKVIGWLEEAGYEKLSDFCAETPENINFRVEIATGITRNKNAMKAYENLIAFAKSQA